jgi:hypothetical protein
MRPGVSGGQFFNGGTGCITNGAGQFSSWYGVLATSKGTTCVNGGITSAAMVIDRFGNEALKIHFPAVNPF